MRRGRSKARGISSHRGSGFHDYGLPSGAGSERLGRYFRKGYTPSKKQSEVRDRRVTNASMIIDLHNKGLLKLPLTPRQLRLLEYCVICGGDPREITSKINDETDKVYSVTALYSNLTRVYDKQLRDSRNEDLENFKKIAVIK